MSVTVECYFSLELGVDELRQALDAALGCTLAPDTLSTRLFGMALVLESPHTSSDEPQFSLAGYQHALVTRTGGLARSRPIQLATTATFPFVLFEYLGVERSNLVYDGQLLLAEYETSAPGGALVDRISGERVRYPEHLATLTARLAAEIARYRVP